MRISDWVSKELGGTLSLRLDDASRIGAVCESHPATTVAIARAVASIPKAREWWDEHRDSALASLRRGEVGNVEVRLSEALVPTAPDVIDFNWAAHKVFWAVKPPEGIAVGQRFLVGDGMGGRAWAEVVEKGGASGVAVVEALANPLSRFFVAAWVEAEELMRAPPIN
ncbi:MAG: hypothetical protein ABR540_19380 [Acidimicrobiales bacterium]